MRFAEIANIWTVDLRLLSNADRGRVYFERAKQVISEAFDDPAKLAKAVYGTSFRRTYLTENIGSQPAVAQQNPKIRSLLADADSKLKRASIEAASRRDLADVEP